MDGKYIGDTAHSFADYVEQINFHEIVGCEIHLHTADGGYFMTGFGKVPPPVERIMSLAAELADLREKLKEAGVL